MKYKEKCPHLPLPQSPLITRWGTWLQTNCFYFDNLDAVANVEFINVHFRELPNIIKYFETQNLKLEYGIHTLNKTLNKLKCIPGDFGKRLNKKIDAVFERNPYLHTLKNLSSRNFKDIEMLHKNFVSYFQYAPLTICDVERSFSILKNILSSKRTNFSKENLENGLIINVNKLLL